MATKFLSGFETNDFSEWTATVGSPVVQSTVVRSGDAAAELDATGDIFRWFETTEIGDLALRFFFYIDVYVFLSCQHTDVLKS